MLLLGISTHSTWLHSDRSDIRWLSIEQHMLKATPLKNLPFLGSKKNLPLITKNAIISSTFRAWQETHALFGLDISLLRETPLWNNPNILTLLQMELHRNGPGEWSKELATYSNNILSSFQQLSSKFSLPQNNHFKFLQIRHWLQDNCADFPNLPEESPFEKHLLDKWHSSTRGLTSSVYILNRNLSIYDRLSIKNKWETDLGCNYKDVEWQNILERSQTVLISTKHRDIGWGVNLNNGNDHPITRHWTVRMTLKPEELQTESPQDNHL